MSWSTKLEMKLAHEQIMHGATYNYALLAAACNELMAGFFLYPGLQTFL